MVELGGEEKKESFRLIKACLFKINELWANQSQHLSCRDAVDKEGKTFRAEALEDGRKRPCIISLQEAMATSLTEEDEASCCERSGKRCCCSGKRIKD